MVKAYVPFGTVTKITAEGISQDDLQISVYPDEGVKFAGYYKKRGANGKYELRPQELINGFSIVQTQNTLVYTPPAGKKFYITDLIISSKNEATDPETALVQDFISGTDYEDKIGFTLPQATGQDHNIMLHFGTPIKFTRGLRLSLGVIAVYYLLFTYVGWLE